ncbi:phosphotyrosine protein phosphatase [Candidatus Woesearchaeota archaeon]|nr:phosphotyrosine protein phosphatase [Candidatus Woesearchaeota archaeon]
MNKLFVCNLGKYRSRTAANIFGGKYAGVFVNLKKEDLEWADIVYVFEERQRSEIGKQFPTQYLKKRILNLDISDVYGYMDDKLVDVLRRKLG